MIWPTNNKMPRCLFKMKYQERSSGSCEDSVQFLHLSAALRLIQDRLRSLTSKTTALTTPWPEPLSKSQLNSSHPTGWLRQKDSTVVAPAFSYLWEKSSSCFLGCFTHSSPFLHNVGPQDWVGPWTRKRRSLVNIRCGQIKKGRPFFFIIVYLGESC